MTRAAFFFRRFLTVVSLLGLLGLSGCATQPRQVCPPGLQASLNETLYFGTDKRAATAMPVTREEWKVFVAEFIAPVLPDGLTWWKAHGYWKKPGQPAERETAYVVQIIHPQGVSLDQAVDGVVARYKEKFDQESVLRTTTALCSGAR